MSRALLRPWHEAFDRLLDRPLLERAVLVLSIFTAAHVTTSVVSYLAIKHSGQTDPTYFGVLLTVGVGIVGTSTAALAVIARRDAHGTSAAARFTLLATAAVYPLFGVAVAYSLGFWASPFALFPAVTALIVGVLFGRTYGWAAVVSSLSVISVLEVLQRLDVIPYAPALRDRSVDGSGEFLRVLGTSVPLVAFTLIAITLSFGVLALFDRQRAALAASHDMIRRYVPAQVADAVLAHGESSTTLQRRKLTVFFSDVVGFTETTERLEPEELEVVLGEYFSEMARIATDYDGTIDELVGDAILILFGAPTATSDRDHARRAVRMAIDMQQAVEGLNARWEEAGIDVVFRIRMGINTGVVAVGNVGSGARQKYAAIGRGVNLAARIQSESPPGGILMTRATWLLVRDEVACTLRGEVELKGVSRTTELYSVDL